MHPFDLFPGQAEADIQRMHGRMPSACLDQEDGAVEAAGDEDGQRDGRIGEFE